MERVALGEIQVSRIVYGMWRLCNDPDTSEGHVQAKVEACLAQGITTMDHADVYGGYRVEEVFGQMLSKARALKDQIEIISKCGIVAPAGRHSGAPVKHYDTSAKHLTESVESSLRLLGVDRIDLLLIHRPDPFMDANDTGRALDALVAAGKIRSAGVSNFKPHDWSLLQSAMHTRLVTNQIEMSLAHLAPFTDGDLAFVQERGVKPMAWSPLGGGGLMTGKSGHGPLRTALADMARAQGTDMSAIAVAWLLAHPAGILPVMGTNNLGRIKSLSAATEVTMSRTDWFRLYALAQGRDVP